MILAALILILSTGLFFYYLQSLCRRILRREFEKPYFELIVTANQLEFPTVLNALEANAQGVDYSRLRSVLKCDFAALTYLLKHVAEGRGHTLTEEWLLVLYARWLFLSLALRDMLRLEGRSAALRLTGILRHFANVVGRRVAVVRLGNLAPSA